MFVAVKENFFSNQHENDAEETIDKLRKDIQLITCILYPTYVQSMRNFNPLQILALVPVSVIVIPASNIISAIQCAMYRYTRYITVLAVMI